MEESPNVFLPASAATARLFAASLAMFVRQEEDDGDGEVEEGGEVAGEGRMATKSINKSGSRGISAPREKVEGEEDWRGASATFLSPRLDFFPQISIPSFFRHLKPQSGRPTPPARNSPLTNC